MAKKWANLEAWFMSEVDADVRDALAEQIGGLGSSIMCVTSPLGLRHNRKLPLAL